MTIRRRLFISFFIFVVFILLIGLGTFFVVTQSNYFLKLALENYTMLVNTQNLYLALENQKRAFYAYLILGEEIDRLEYENLSEMIDRDIMAYPDEEARRVCSEMRNYQKKIVALHSKLTKGDFHSFLDKQFNSISTQMKNILMNNTEHYKRKIEDIKVRMRKLCNISYLAGIWIFVLALVLSLLLTLMLFKYIAIPLFELFKGVNIIGGGNLDYEIPLLKNSSDELYELTVAFNKMVKEIKNLQVQVLQMDRMSSLGQLAGGVAHELNNPLTGVIGQTQLLLEKFPPDSPVYQTLKKIEHAGQRCRRIVRALLDFARQKDYAFAKHNIHQLIDEVLELSSSDLRAAKVEVIKEYGKDLPPVNVSGSHIQQVILNIVTNALQSMAPKNGGVLRIMTRYLPEMKKIEVEFIDTGIGIKKEHLPHIFDPFFTTKEVGKGTGLGLTVSYGIIQKHNGEILAYSDGEGKGAKFVIRLPTEDGRD